MIDVKFAHILYKESASIEENAHLHGEQFREAIKELCHIRKELMIEKNPTLKSSLGPLAGQQFHQTQIEMPDQALELYEISRAANVALTDLIILNNYTDFRDIDFEDEGCSTIGLNSKDKVSAQTWDMHSTAKNYVCIIEMPNNWACFSLVGCLGMMGANKHSQFIGVNNLSTQKAKAGVIWPCLVRHSLMQNNFEDMKRELTQASVTSGHNYLISDGKNWENWELSPSNQECAGVINNRIDRIYHTNHCLNEKMIKNEKSLSQASTTHNRFNLIKQKIDSCSSEQDILMLLQDHDEYPKSICSHYESGAHDPSTTCGGAIFNHNTKKMQLWRNCPKSDQYIIRQVSL